MYEKGEVTCLIAGMNVLRVFYLQPQYWTKFKTVKTNIIVFEKLNYIWLV